MNGASASRVATRRLIDAAATLDAADRALLNIWVNRGLDDAALARMTGMRQETIAGRRARIVEHLSVVLELPPEDVRSALDEATPDPQLPSAAAADAPAAQADPPTVNGTAPSSELLPAAPHPNGSAPAGVSQSTNGGAPPLEPADPLDTSPTPAADSGLETTPEVDTVAEVNTAPSDADTAEPETAPEPELASEPEPAPVPETAPEPEPAPEPETAPVPDTESSSGRRWWLWGALAGLVIAAVAVGLIVALGSSKSGTHRARTPASTKTVPSASVPSSSTTPSPPASPPSKPAANPSSSPAASSPSSAPLAALPGGQAEATGTVRIVRRRSHLKLRLSVKGLSPATHGHYEVWLYDSLIYSKALGRLRTGVRHISFRLPHNARRFRWIDVSFQPVGQVFNSGESVLRSVNPLLRSAQRSR